MLRVKLDSSNVVAHEVEIESILNTHAQKLLLLVLTMDHFCGVFLKFVGESEMLKLVMSLAFALRHFILEEMVTRCVSELTSMVMVLGKECISPSSLFS